MPKTNTSKQTPKFDPASAAHQPFSWLHPAVKACPAANFVALTKDISLGLSTCLEIVYASELDRAHNANADPGQEVLSAVTGSDAENLFRLVIVTSRLLAEHAEQELQRINERAMPQTEGGS